MPGDLIVSGHGKWDPANAAVTLPSGTTVKFYADFMRATTDENGRLIERFSDVLAQVEPTEYTAGDACWDFTISPPTGLTIYRKADDPAASDDYDQWIADDEYRLSQLLRMPEFQNRTLHWAACVAVDLDSAGGRFVGANAAQANLGQGDYEQAGTAQYYDGDRFDTAALLATAFPGLSPPAEARFAVNDLATAAQSRNPTDLVDMWRSLKPDERNGMRLNDTLNWWLADLGLAESLDSGEPELVGLRWDQIDWGFVEAVNQATLKGLDESDSVPYWQANGCVLLGTDHPASYRWAFEEALGHDTPDGSHPNGDVTMVEKGGFTTRGSISVTGSDDAGAFEASVGRFTKKQIDFT